VDRPAALTGTPNPERSPMPSPTPSIRTGNCNAPLRRPGGVERGILNAAKKAHSYVSAGRRVDSTGQGNTSC
jgi:hypothetical protein